MTIISTKSGKIHVEHFICLIVELRLTHSEVFRWECAWLSKKMQIKVAKEGGLKGKINTINYFLDYVGVKGLLLKLTVKD